MKIQGNYQLLQQILDEQGYVVVCHYGPHGFPVGGVIPENTVCFKDFIGETINGKMVCVGLATVEEWLSQQRKYFHDWDSRWASDLTFYKVVAE